jgi:hypothetical protein
MVRQVSENGSADNGKMMIDWHASGEGKEGVLGRKMIPCWRGKFQGMKNTFSKLINFSKKILKTIF